MISSIGSLAMSQAGNFSYIFAQSKNDFDDTFDSTFSISKNETNTESEIENLRVKYEEIVSSHIFNAGNMEAFKGYIRACLGGDIAQVAESVFSNPNANQYYDEFEKTINWEEEWQNYLETKGCKNGEELAILNTTMCKSIAQLKNMTATNLNYVMTNGMIRNPKMASAPSMVDDLINSANIEDIARYLNSTYSDFNTTVSATQDFLSKINSNNFSKDYLERIIADLDKLSKQIEAEKDIYNENGYVDFSAYYQQYNQNMIAKYGQTGMIGQNFRDIYV